MAFQRKRKIYILDFADTELDGLEVKVRPMSMGDALTLQELSDTEGLSPADRAKKIRELIAHFAQAVVSWDLVDEDGNPVPASAEGLGALTEAEVLAVIRAYQDATTAVPVPLGGRSTDGALASLPVETLPPASLAS